MMSLPLEPRTDVVVTSRRNVGVAASALALFVGLVGCAPFPQHVRVYPGGPPQRYKQLGQVSATYDPGGWEQPGGYAVDTYGASVSTKRTDNYRYHDRTMHYNPIPRDRDYPFVNGKLVEQAYERYGAKLAAVINTRYSTNIEYRDPRDTSPGSYQRLMTSATGMAVCYLDPRGRCIEYEPGGEIVPQGEAVQTHPAGERRSTKVAPALDRGGKRRGMAAAPASGPAHGPTAVPEPQPLPSAEPVGKTVDFEVQLAKLLPPTIGSATLKSRRLIRELAKGNVLMAYDYGYTTFSARVLEFDSAASASGFIRSTAIQSKATDLGNGLAWVSGTPSCPSCGSLVFLLSSTRVITIYPGDKQQSTAESVAGVIMRQVKP